MVVNLINIRLIDETGMAKADLDNITNAVQYYSAFVAKAWDLGALTVVSGGTALKGEWIIYITERKRKTGAAGYHTFENQTPVAYCSLKASGRLYGHYIKPLIIKGKQIHGAFYTSGLVTVICHELAEMLCDPKIETISAQDSLGRTWLVEVCDHVFGSYQNYVVNGNNCILPDATTPNFYKLGAAGPYDLFGAATAPFTMTPKGYAYYKDSTGKLVKI